MREAIARRHRERTGQAVSAARCAVFAGAQNALFSVAQCLLESGTEVLIPEPFYTTYPATFSAAGAARVSVAPEPRRGFQLDPDAIAAGITPRTRALVLNSPNNPLGVVYQREALQALVEVCRAREVWLISDEVYAELIPAEDFCSPASLPGADEICVTVSSLSKSHRMTGWRLGWVVGPPALMPHLYNLSMCMSYGLPPFIQDAAVAALDGDTAVTEEISANMRRRRGVVLDALNDCPALRLYSSPGGMFVVLDIAQLGVTARDFAWGLLDQYNVSVLPCEGFGGGGERLLRLSLCVGEAKLRLACERIQAHIDALD